MNKNHKEIEKTKISHEQKAFQELRKTYTQALADTKQMVKKLQEDVNILESSNLGDKSILQSRIYQLNYQKAMEEQLTAIMDVVNSKNVTNVQTFLTKMYQDSYLGVNYNLQKSGIPIIMPINPSLIVKSINTPTNKLKFSETLYKRTDELKKAYKEEISRGIATGKGYKEIAKQLDAKTKIGFNNAFRIARTEGGRVSSEASMTAMRDAKAKGADIVKQWLATLDMRTRDTHGKLDGQIREIDEDFEIDGYKAQCPHGFGYPEMDINCRCAVLSVPRWDIEDSNIRYDDKHGCLIEAKNYDDWKKGYFVKLEENPEVTKVILEAEKRIKGYQSYKTVIKEVSDKVDEALGKEVIYNQISQDQYTELSEKCEMINQENIELINDIYVKQYESTIINDMFREFGDEAYEEFKKAGRYDFYDVSKALDKATNSYQLEENIRAYRYVLNDYIENVYNINPEFVEELDLIVEGLQGYVGSVIEANGFTSTSTSLRNNEFTEYPVLMVLDIDEGFTGYFANNVDESELILPRNTKMELIDVDIDEVDGVEKLVFHYKVVK